MPRSELRLRGFKPARQVVEQVLGGLERQILGYLWEHGEASVRAPYRRWQREQEKACDDYACEQTNAPLELASALVKTGKLLPVGTRLNSLLMPGLGFHRPGEESLLAERIQRLIELSVSAPRLFSSPLLRLHTACGFAALVVTAMVTLILASPHLLLFYHYAIETLVRLLS